MEFVREAGELRGNQGAEGEESVISVEPITMVVPSELQDLPETLTPESSASLGAHEGSGANPSPSSEGSSSENTTSASSPSPESIEVAVNVPPVADWENKSIGGRLSNLRKAPHTLTAGFRFRANLHHDVANCATSIKGACSVSATGWIPVYVDHFDAGLRSPLAGLIFDILAKYELVLTQLTPNSIKFIVEFMLLCARLEIPAKAIVFKSLFLCQLSTTQTRWYYISEREKMAIFKNVRNKWRLGHAYMNYPTLIPGDLELKDRITNYVKGEGLVDLEALVTPKLLALRGFVDVTNLFSEGEMSSMLERQRERAQRSRGRGTGSSTRRQTRFDELPPTAPRSSSQREQGSSSTSRPRAERRVETVPTEVQRRAHEDFDAEDDVPLIRRRLNARSQPGAGMQSFIPPVDRQHAKGYIQQHESHAAMLKMMDAARVQNRELADSCKRLSSNKASLEDEVNQLQNSEIANRAASVESQADELANKVNQLHEELDKVKAEKESGIQVAMDEVIRADLARAEESLKKAKAEHQRCISIARAQGAEWLVGADMFQDVVAVASMNTTTEIYNEVRGKVLKHRPDFPINELSFFEGEEFDAEGKSLTTPSDTTLRLHWELNEEGLPI
ncbi:hypothetical protein SLEP1_g38015 [Rubroshorea leprosula]|uniref:Transposase (putative) gypsy type domain-containing protein n=1 Tax=Rubroshorea leprosula TaxID=152421 RepID=A0AAV5KWN7_9ROSI|nr:hypothetical protein SLEP1_g38015 [Rubroshorea leprosula]